MKRYFINGVEIPEEEAHRIEADNMRYLDSEDLEQWAKIQFIAVINI